MNLAYKVAVWIRPYYVAKPLPLRLD